MADTFQLQIATPERLVVDVHVNEAQWPCQNGYMGVLPGHAPLVSALGTGVLTYSDNAGQKAISINGGFVEIIDNHVRLLTDSASFTQE